MSRNFPVKKGRDVIIGATDQEQDGELATLHFLYLLDDTLLSDKEVAILVMKGFLSFSDIMSRDTDRITEWIGFLEGINF